MKIKVLILLLALAAPLALAVAGEKSGKAADAPLLPASFNGWQKNAATVKISADPAVADPADAAVLKEYGFAGVELASYTRDDRTMQVKAARFNDASGAYGAFTYYGKAQMQTEKIGDESVSFNTRVLFYRSNVLVDVTLDRVTAMSAADLRALAELLPRVRGNVAALPSLPLNLPRQSLMQHTGRYIMGPVALERLGVPLPPSLVDFTKSPELAFANYRTTYGEANVTLVAYPTPQIAAERLKAMQAAEQAGALPGSPFKYKRSGPIVALVNGQIPDTEAESLLASVNYDAEVTWNQPTKADRREDAAGLLIGVIVLIGIILVFAVISGLAFGGLRIVAQRLFPGRFIGRPREAEMIRLDLK
ncbi:MAG: hypothetical protein LAP21_12425 [Acidobacteriia bacterium]|nr:hypothetical protein [Terriglobia bacterium]